MKNLVNQLFLRSRYPLAALTGLLLAMAFLELGLEGMAWVAPALILATARGKTAGETFRIGYVAGLAHYLASLYWILLIPVTGYPILGWISLSAYLALYPATWVWLMSSKIGKGGWTDRTVWAFTGAALWVGLEMIVSRLFTGFPWNLIGTSQYKLLPLIQIASFTGVYGVSFVVVWVSLSIYSGALAILRSPTNRFAWYGDILVPLGVVVVIFIIGLGRLRDSASPEATVRVTFIQPSIPQTMIWNQKDNDVRFNQLLDLTTQALTNQTDLLLWPEAAVPKMLRYDEDTFRAITHIARTNGIWMIVGSDDAEPKRNSSKADQADYFNSSFLIGPEGQLVSEYRKRYLVIFGEYIPLIRWLPFIKWFTPITGGFTAGDKVSPYQMTIGHGSSQTNEGAGTTSPAFTVKTATLICFEDVFPHLVREYVDEDTDFLVNLTNDGWFGEGAEQWQHAASGAFRAVENGIPLARSCNNGLTCWIDSKGRFQNVFRDEQRSVYGPGVMRAEIPVLGVGEKRTLTFYSKHGDWFGWSCTIWSALAVIVMKFMHRKTNPAS